MFSWRRYLILIPIISVWVLTPGYIWSAILPSSNSIFAEGFTEKKYQPIKQIASSRENTVSKFIFEPAMDCKTITGDSEARCAAMSPKDWNQDEIASITGYLNDFANAMPQFVSKVVVDGPLRLYRVNSFVDWNTRTQSYEARSTGSGEYVGGFGILLSDFGMNQPKSVDTLLGFSRVSLLLLHELAHAFEFERAQFASESPEFLHAAGWEFANGYKLKNLDSDETAMAEAAYNNALAAGNIATAVQIQKDFGRKFGLPTLYATSRPSECFAEVVAWIFHDKTALSYLKPELVRYMREYVTK